MILTVPHTRPGVWPASIAPSRFASTIRTGDPSGCRVGLLGLPDDLGVRLNGGRPGAAEGPTAFRAALARYGVAEPAGFVWPGVFDAGDVVPAEGDSEATLHETHRRVTEAAAAILDAGLFPIAVGGGHDLTYSFVRAAVVHVRRSRPQATFGGVYFDAHLDVREGVGSGMPFRRLMEDCGVGPLNCVGASALVNSREHAAYLELMGGAINGKPLRAGSAPPTRTDAGFVSLDLDAFDQAYAPGVSAMNPAGLTPLQVSGTLSQLGASREIVCFDVMELSPPHDEHGRTARLAAHMVLSFLAGFARRGASG
jgi:formiminoglutamase